MSSFFVEEELENKEEAATAGCLFMATGLSLKLLELTQLRYEISPKLMETIQSDNSAIGDILKCHLFTECLLEKLIKFFFGKQSEAILSIQLSYQNKLDLVSGLKVDDTYPALDQHIVGSLKKLNTLRNKVAHRIDVPISSSDLISLLNGLESELPYDDMSEVDPKILIKRYMAFIFGNMLPKYEAIDS